MSLPFGMSFLRNENRKFDCFCFPVPYGKEERKFKSVFNAIGKRNTKVEVRIPFSNVVGKQKWKNGNGNWNSVFSPKW